jgi:SprT-like protein
MQAILLLAFFIFIVLFYVIYLNNYERNDCMTDEQLNELVKKISIKYFDRKFLHKAFFNYRLKTTGGRYNLKSHCIDINPKILEKYSYDILLGVIKHELCHYHLHLLGYSGRHNTKKFIDLLNQVEGSRYVPILERQKNLKYVCQKCGCVYIRHRKINSLKYVCSKCHGNIKLS